MEQDSNKRKSSQEFLDEATGSKKRKISSQTTINSFSSTQKSTITENIVSLWKKGSGLTSIAAQENIDIIKLREFEAKSKEADKIIQSMKKKLYSSDEQISELNILLKKEIAEKQNLLNKMSSIWELIANISQHINYITESLDRFQMQINHLSTKYDNVIVQLQSKNSTLSAEIEQMINSRQSAVEEIQRKLDEKELELNDLKANYKMLTNRALQEKEETQGYISELENMKKKLTEVEIIENKLKLRITELEEIISIETDKMQQINDINEAKCNEMKNNYELKISELNKNFEDAEKKLINSEQCRVELMENLEEKNKLVKNQEEKTNLYQKQVRELLCQLTDTGVNFHRAQDESNNLQKQLEKTRNELSSFQQEFEALTVEKCKLADEVSKLNETLKKETKERMELSANLTQSRIQLQEAINKNNDMYQRLNKNNEDKQSDVNNLQIQIEILKEKLDQVVTEKNVEIKIRDELERKHENEMKSQREKYEKCLADLDELSNSMKNSIERKLITDSELESVTTEKENITKLYLSEKEKIEEKLKKSEELLSKKIDSEKELKKKLSKFQADLKIAEKKYKDLESNKNNKIMVLEKELSNLGLSTAVESTPAIQTRGNVTKSTKNIRMKQEIITAASIKSILKPHINTYTDKSSPKKISFNFGSDSSDDFGNIQLQNPDDKFDDFIKSTSDSALSQLPNSQPTTPETPKKKFFKFRGN
ncbi:hypothetical protein PV327_008717 [Microctonus hyperodae]|uniref:Synaptonemal complex protein 1 n=1 Tax=Microctonus hyperodae TaxID=165561 RepID=A0AA39F3S1_MICHY|nr:hypothetical protein PV327_008717 [Microctonus hyperodae]